MASQRLLRFGCVVLFALTIIIAATPINAQLATATILGTVKDASGAVVAGAAVTIRAVDTGQVRTSTTGTDGAYRVSALPIGHYDVQVESQGFKTGIQAGLTLTVAQEAEINFTLQVGSTDQQVRVTGDAPIVNTTSSDVGTLVNETAMADLPVNGRNYANLTLLATGVTEDKAVTSEGAGRGLLFSSSGATPWSNYFTIDGAPMVNALGEGAGNSSGETLGMDGIQEFRLISSSYGAQYGMVMGAQVVMVSKSGTNRLHGSVFDYLRNSVFDARNFFDYGFTQPGGTRIPHFSRNNFGGSLGGPIKKDKTFYFVTYEGLRQAQGVTTVDTVLGPGCHVGAGVTTVAATCQAGAVVVSATMAPLVALYPIPNLPNNQFTFPSTNPSSTDYGQMRVDHTFSTSDSLFVRYTVDNGYLNTVNVQTGAPINGPAYPGFSLLWNGRDQFASVGENHVFSTSLLNTARVSLSRNNGAQAQIDPGEPSGPQYTFVAGQPMGSITVSSLTGPYGINPSRPIYNIQTVYTASDDLLYTHGRHALKFGVLAHRYYQALGSAITAPGSLSFTSIANFLQGKSATYTSLTPGSINNHYYAYNTFGFYAQDDWRATNRLTVNMGYRYEFMTTANALDGYQSAIRNVATDANGTLGPLMRNPTYKDFSPRLGFAYDVFGNGKTAVHGAFGVYDDVGNIGIMLKEALQGTPPISNRNLVVNSTAAFVLPFQYSTANIGTSPQILDYDARTPHSLEYNLAVEQQLPFGVGLSVAYVGLRGIDLWSRGEANFTNVTSVTNGVQFWGPTTTSCYAVVPSCRVNPHFTSIAMDATIGNSWYNSLQVIASKRLSRGLEFQGAYTFSQNLDETSNMSGDSGSSPGCLVGVDPANRSDQKGPSCYDATHNLRFNLMYHFGKVHGDGIVSKLANGWWMGNIVSVQSGTPFTPILSTNRSRSGVNLGSSGSPQADYASLNTAASIAANPCTSLPGQAGAGSNPCAYNPIPYNQSTVITGNPNQWYNPAMFNIGLPGFLGSASRDMLRGPGLGTWDFSLVKDTPLNFVSEGANLEFRAEFFNMLNRANFGIPSGTTFSGSLNSPSPYFEAPSGTAGQITYTSTTSRQIQFALRMTF